MTTTVLQLEIIDADGNCTMSRCISEPLWLGRDPECSLELPSPNVSRRHVELRWTADGLSVTDASANGTVVNETLLRRATRVIRTGQATLGIGPFQVRVSPKAVAYDIVPPRGQPDSAALTPKQVELPFVPGHALSPSDNGSPINNDPATAEGPEAETGAGVRRLIRRQLLQHLDLPSLNRHKMKSDAMRPEVTAALRRIVAALVPGNNHEALVQELADEALGLGPLERFLADPDISEIMVVDPETIFVERRGKVELTTSRFTDDDSVRAVIERIVTPLGRRIDESTPLVDARLRDGSRVNAVIPPLALRGPCITIRKFAKDPLRMADLIRYETLSTAMARFLERAVAIRKNIIISGGTGSGKTTLLNVLSAAIPPHERVVTIEDAAELQLAQPHVVSLEARPPNLEGKGEYSIRDLVKNALRMRPDRIVVGECRSGEAIDMLQAMNTGHEGSLTTTHANSPTEAINRLETLCLMAGLDLPVRAIRQQIASSIHLIVQQTRFSDGSRRITKLSEVVGLNDEGDVELRDIFTYTVHQITGSENIRGDFSATGYLPSFLDQFITQGLVDQGDYL
jgi:pilus assembly protein CpaF